MASSWLRYPRYWWRLLRRPQVVTLHGVRLELGPHLTPELRRAIYRERYERGEARALRHRLEADDRVLEVGAGVGFLSALAALAIGSERVVAYEANPAMLPVIEHTWQLNGVQPTLIHAVLGEGGGSETFWVEDHFVSSSLKRRSESSRPVEVPRLDVGEELARHRPTVVVLDVEGAELELVPAIPWEGVSKVVIDLHPRVIGEEGIATVLGHLGDAGFAPVRRLSTSTKKLLERIR